MSHRTCTPSRSSWPLAALLLASVSLPAAAIEGPPGPFGERLTIDEKGITLKFPDDAATLRIGGRLQLDFGTGRVQQRGFGTVFDTPIAVRRSWIESYLTLGKELELAFQYDFADLSRPIQDAVVAYKGFKDVIVAIGNMKEPFSLNQLISDNNTLFTERSLADAFAPARNVGLAIGTHGENWTAVTSVFGGNINNAAIGDQGIASTTRVTYAPYLSKDGYDVLHVGLAGSYRSLPNDGSALTLSNRSEAFLFARQFVNTGSIRDAASIGRTGRPTTSPTSSSAGCPPSAAIPATTWVKPASMTARRTTASRTPKALATAASTTPSRAPCRRLPVTRSRRKRCSSAVARPMRSTKLST